MGDQDVAGAPGRCGGLGGAAGYTPGVPCARALGPEEEVDLPPPMWHLGCGSEHTPPLWETGFWGSGQATLLTWGSGNFPKKPSVQEFVCCRMGIPEGNL